MLYAICIPKGHARANPYLALKTWHSQQLESLDVLRNKVRVGNVYGIN